ncbi:hypothetical protein ACIB24_19370 [Spongisporangium articulatum]|uniref:Uncharacterized protein n=1 Tax=Spongisporangium articulatum TaxID=3362603 RepID=A0ABW8AS86_9ACTN
MDGAVAWLLDVCPPDYRGYPVLRRHPTALAWLAARHVAAGREAMHRSLATARAELADSLDAAALRDVVEVLELEQLRMLSIGRSVALVSAALPVPRPD